MVGGQIIDVTRQPGNLVRLWVLDPTYCDELAVLVREEHDMPVVGDQIWWQSGKVYWTPSDRRFADKALVKVGNSYDPRIVEG